MAKRENGAVDRISLRPKTRDDFNAMRLRLGMTQDGFVQWLMRQQMREGEDARQAGERLWREWEEKQFGNSLESIEV